MELRTYVEQLQSIERQYAPPNAAADPSAFVTELEAWRRQEPDREEVCSTGDATGAWLLLRLCARYGLKPFREPKQKPTTITVRAPQRFMTKVLWPQLQAMARVFAAAKADVANEIVDSWLGKEGADEVLTLEEERPGQ